MNGADKLSVSEFRSGVMGNTEECKLNSVKDEAVSHLNAKNNCTANPVKFDNNGHSKSEFTKNKRKSFWQYNIHGRREQVYTDGSILDKLEKQKFNVIQQGNSNGHAKPECTENDIYTRGSTPFNQVKQKFNVPREENAMKKPVTRRPIMRHSVTEKGLHLINGHKKTEFQRDASPPENNYNVILNIDRLFPTDDHKKDIENTFAEIDVVADDTTDNINDGNLEENVQLKKTANEETLLSNDDDDYEKINSKLRGLFIGGDDNENKNKTESSAVDCRDEKAGVIKTKNRLFNNGNTYVLRTNDGLLNDGKTYIIRTNDDGPFNDGETYLLRTNNSRGRNKVVNCDLKGNKIKKSVRRNDEKVCSTKMGTSVSYSNSNENLKVDRPFSAAAPAEKKNHPQKSVGKDKENIDLQYSMIRRKAR